MKKLMIATMSVAAMTLLSACASAPAAQVVRFHGNQPAQRGTVHMVPANPAMAGTLEFKAQAAPLAAELTRIGFVVVEDAAQAQFTAMIDVGIAQTANASRTSGLTIGIGGGFSSGNVGIGSSVQLPVGGQQQPAMTGATTLAVRISDKATGQAVWEGRATANATDGNGPVGTPAVAPLAGALFRDFPGPNGRSVSVPL